MGKKHRRRQRQVEPVVTLIDQELLLATIQTRANVRAVERGHMLGIWNSAKHKYGKGAKQALCVWCKQKATILPRGAGPSTLPRLQGGAVFEECQVKEHA